MYIKDFLENNTMHLSKFPWVDIKASPEQKDLIAKIMWIAVYLTFPFWKIICYRYGASDF